MTREQFNALFPECQNNERMDVPIEYFHQRMKEMTNEEVDIVFPNWRRVVDQIRRLPVREEGQAAS